MPTLPEETRKKKHTRGGHGVLLSSVGGQEQIPGPSPFPRERGRQGTQEEHPRLRFRRCLILPLIFSVTKGMRFHL